MQDRGPTVLVVVIVMLCLSTVFVALRLVSRIAFGFSVSICYGTSVGLGRHEANVEPQDHMPLKKAEYAFSVLYVRDSRYSTHL